LGAIKFDTALEDLIGDAHALVESTVATRLKEIIVSNPGFDLEH
jgi:hypothetical protein